MNHFPQEMFTRSLHVPFLLTSMGVLGFLNLCQFMHATMEVLIPTRYKTTKIRTIGHTHGTFEDRNSYIENNVDGLV